MAIQSIDNIMKEQEKARRFKLFLNKIANSADAGIYYNKNVREMQESLENIQKLTVQALNSGK